MKINPTSAYKKNQATVVGICAINNNKAKSKRRTETVQYVLTDRKYIYCSG